MTLKKTLLIFTVLFNFSCSNEDFSYQTENLNIIKAKELFDFYLNEINDEKLINSKEEGVGLEVFDDNSHQIRVEELIEKHGFSLNDCFIYTSEGGGRPEKTKYKGYAKLKKGKLSLSFKDNNSNFFKIKCTLEDVKVSSAVFTLSFKLEKVNEHIRFNNNMDQNISNIISDFSDKNRKFELISNYRILEKENKIELGSFNVAISEDVINIDEPIVNRINKFYMIK